jgi:hypothetical protein
VTVKWLRRFAFLAVLALLPGMAGSTHEVSHRYVVLGYVKDAKDRPLPGVQIELIREKTGLSYVVETDRQGLYAIVVHLHDEDAGDRLRVNAMGATATVIARFDPKNQSDERGTRLDFLGKKPVERAAWFPGTLKRFLAR